MSREEHQRELAIDERGEGGPCKDCANCNQNYWICTEREEAHVEPDGPDFHCGLFRQKKAYVL